MTFTSGIRAPDHGGQFCPICGGPEITISELRDKGIEPKEEFECYVCGCKLYYTTIKNFFGEQLLLHVVSSILKADGTLK